MLQSGNHPQSPESLLVSNSHLFLREWSLNTLHTFLGQRHLLLSIAWHVTGTQSLFVKIVYYNHVLTTYRYEECISLETVTFSFQ